MTLMYTLSVFVLVSPLVAMWVLTARLSIRMKATILGSLVFAMLVLPLAAMWLFGGGHDISIPLD